MLEELEALVRGTGDPLSVTSRLETTYIDLVATQTSVSSQLAVVSERERMLIEGLERLTRGCEAVYETQMEEIKQEEAMARTSLDKLSTKAKVLKDTAEISRKIGVRRGAEELEKRLEKVRGERGDAMVTLGDAMMMRNVLADKIYTLNQFVDSLGKSPVDDEVTGLFGEHWETCTLLIRELENIVKERKLLQLQLHEAEAMIPKVTSLLHEYVLLY